MEKSPKDVIDNEHSVLCTTKVFNFAGDTNISYLNNNQFKKVIMHIIHVFVSSICSRLPTNNCLRLFQLLIKFQCEMK